MPDLWMDVDVALSEVPVNIMPLIDDTDFKSRETAVAYNAAGMDLVWNFVDTAGSYTQTAVTPTTSGTYDWTHQGDGMYSIEIPASGGASINNDTEGVGWFTGIATGVLPWRGPTIGFRHSALNNSLIDAGSTGLLAPSVAGRTLVVDSSGLADANAVKVGPSGSGTAQTARDLGKPTEARPWVITTQLWFSSPQHAVSGDTLYAVVHTYNGQYFRWDTAVTESYSGANWTSTKYAKAMTEQNSLAEWKLDYSGSGLSTGAGYIVEIHRQVGGSPATSDPRIGYGIFRYGSFGWLDDKTLGDFIDDTYTSLDATISSRASASALSTAQTDITTIKGYTDDIGVAGAGLTAIPTVAAVTTVTNLTNAPTSGDFTATMKASIRTAVGLASANLDTQLSAIDADTSAVSAMLPSTAFLAGMEDGTYDLASGVDATQSAAQGAQTSANAIAAKLPSRDYLVGTDQSTGAIASADATTIATAVDSATSTYTAEVKLVRDDANSRDVYSVTFKKNGILATVSGTPTINVKNETNGNLIASSNLTAVGSSTYKYVATSTERGTSGVAYTAIVTATIDASSRGWTVPVGKDSTA